MIKKYIYLQMHSQGKFFNELSLKHLRNWVLLIINREGEAMKFEDHLSKEQKQQLRKIQQSITKPITKSKTKQKKQEHLSRREIEDLMGIRMDKFERRRGALRRK